jgi:hypothetical protein
MLIMLAEGMRMTGSRIWKEIELSVAWLICKYIGARLDMCWSRSVRLFLASEKLKDEAMRLWINRRPEDWQIYSVDFSPRSLWLVRANFGQRGDGKMLSEELDRIGDKRKRISLKSKKIETQIGVLWRKRNRLWDERLRETHGPIPTDWSLPNISHKLGHGG